MAAVAAVVVDMEAAAVAMAAAVVVATEAEAVAAAEAVAGGKVTGESAACQMYMSLVRRLHATKLCL